MISNNDILSTFNYSTNDWYTISWKLTNGCNYKCPYCIAQCQSKKIEKYDFVKSVAYQIHEKLINQIDKKISIHFVGGEPSLYNLQELLDIIRFGDETCYSFKGYRLTKSSLKVKKVNLITNFSRKVDYYIEFMKYCKQNFIVLNLLVSYHPTECDKTEFLTKLLELQKYGSFSVGLVFNNENIEKDVVNFCIQNNIKINLSIERDLNNNALMLSDENRKYFEQIESTLIKTQKCIQVKLTTNEIIDYSSTSAFISDIKEGGFIPDNRYCSGGVTSLRILPNGIVARAGCNYCQNNLTLRNILTDNIEIPKENFICRQNESASEIKFCPLCYKVNTIKIEGTLNGKTNCTN